MRVFVAGGTGVIGRRLVPQLLARGHQVTATTTKAAKLDLLARLGAAGVVMNGLDAAEVSAAVAQARPDVIVQQMTAIDNNQPVTTDPDRYFAITNQLRTIGTDNLLAAAGASGVPHVVAQGHASWNGHREGGWVKTEEDPLTRQAGPKFRKAAEALLHLEEVVIKAGGTVVRYGGLYGPGATDDQVMMVRERKYPLVGPGSGYMSWVHVDDAAAATVLAVEQRPAGLYNIVDDEPAAASEWLPYLAACAGAEPPPALSETLVRQQAGEFAVILMTEGRGFSNAKAKRELGWKLRYPSWRQGFKEALA